MSGKQTPERLNIDQPGLARAVELLRAGSTVALPTETVYGLAARADDPEAVAAIYAAKGRPSFNPLIIHVASIEMARRYAAFDARAEELAARFWPGPLTLVLPRRIDAEVAPAVSAGLDTIAIRMPAHAAMRSVIERLGVPLAAPSANRSGGVSPTTAEHVAHSLKDRIAAIVDGGACTCGLESTILALRPTGGWQLLRPGPLEEEALETLLGPSQALQSDRIEAPGQMTSHYAPGKPVRLNVTDRQDDEFLIGFGSVSGDTTLSASGDLTEAANRLYACLFESAESEKPKVAVASIPDTGLGKALNDRLKRAAA